MNAFPWVVVGSTTSDVVLALVCLVLTARIRRGPAATATLDLPRVLPALLLTSGFFVIKLVVFRMLGLRFFAFVTLAYVDLTVALPLLGGAVLLLGRWGMRWQSTAAVRVLALSCLLAAPVGIYATFIEPYRLQIETTTIPADMPSASPPIRIAVLADLQFDRVTSYEHRAVTAALDADPDLIVLPGDFFQGTHEAYRRELPAIRDLLARLRAPGGVYAVQGNMESVSQLREMVSETDVIPLVNEFTWTTVHNRQVAIGGVDLYPERGTGVEVIAQLRKASPRADATLLLAHRPDVALITDDWSGIDLVIAGHTHGGQICLPLVGPPFVASEVPTQVGAGGLHKLNGATLYVSRGVGAERGQCVRMRFLCPPEVSVLTLQAPN